MVNTGKEKIKPEDIKDERILSFLLSLELISEDYMSGERNQGFLQIREDIFDESIN
ncbi:MAG: hypothetical protein ACI4WM_04050 [Erysipelotrichaceae bacterium]